MNELELPPASLHALERGGERGPDATADRRRRHRLEVFVVDTTLPSS